MPRYRIAASDGRIETLITDDFDSQEAARETLRRRGWTEIRSIAEEPAAPAPGPAPKAAADSSEYEISADGQWRLLPFEVATAHPLYGVGGWLVVLAILQVIGTVLATVGFFQLLPYWGYGGLVSVMLPLIGALIALQIWILVMLFLCKPVFPTAFLVVAGLGLAFNVIGIFADPRGALREVVSMAVNIAWMAYVVNSRRVNVTYKHRVKHDDPFLA